MRGALRSGSSRGASSKLSDDEFARAKLLVSFHLDEHQVITNREFRALTQLNYDQAVTFFNRMIADSSLVRVGKASSIRYVRHATPAHSPAP